MPSNVKAFLALNYFSVILGLVYTSLMFSKVATLTAQMGHGKVGGAGFVVASVIITTLLFVALISLAGFGAKNWARWTLLVLFLIGWTATVPKLFASTEHYPFERIEESVQTALQMIALFLIFTGNARSWFRRKEPEQVD